MSASASRLASGEELRRADSKITLLPANCRTLTIGDGDFAFSHALVEKWLPLNANLVATSYDSADEVHKKYAQSAERMTRMREAGVHVLCGVDATQLHQSPLAEKPAFDRIVFNFPQVPGSKDVVANRLMLAKFLRRAEAFLTLDGLILIANKDVSPYCWWRLEALHEFAGCRLNLAAELPWTRTEYPSLYAGPCNVDRDQAVKAGNAVVFVYARPGRSDSVHDLPSTPSPQGPQEHCCKICRVWPQTAADLKKHESGKMHRKRAELEQLWEKTVAAAGSLDAVETVAARAPPRLVEATRPGKKQRRCPTLCRTAEDLE